MHDFSVQIWIFLANNVLGYLISYFHPILSFHPFNFQNFQKQISKNEMTYPDMPEVMFANPHSSC